MDIEIKNRMHKTRTPLWISYAAVLVVLAIWEIFCRTGLISSLFLPAPTQILSALCVMTTSGELADNLTASLIRISAGFLTGSVIGIVVGLISGVSSLADRVATPFVDALYPIPKIALLPLFILWLGIGETSKIALIALGVFFPVALNTYAGAKNVPPLLLRVSVSFRARPLFLLSRVILPASLPMIWAGLRIAAATSLLLVVAAEMIAAEKGIGALILRYGDLMLTDRLMAGLLVLSATGLLFRFLLNFAARRIMPWKQ